ncbi:hypothetical protein KTC96_11380 [Clostridium estertheticum]|uniref:hypothetical protein n=1 Tax=Clostridium estertheticum TaxID=238834 RepID=UPI0027154238|nr:hypothetical protein [Clostridium estertheticum]WLC68627.1 hypothetical protein KTC96_11380 [Clostridium estertheticum]
MAIKKIFDEMRKFSLEEILIWRKEEVNDWSGFLEKYTDKNELRFLEIEISDSFFINTM